MKMHELYFSTGWRILLANYKIATSPLSGRIFLGKINRKGDTWLDNPPKVDVTGDACAAVAIHTLMEGGKTIVTANGKPMYEITARKVVDET